MHSSKRLHYQTLGVPALSDGLSLSELFVRNIIRKPSYYLGGINNLTKARYAKTHAYGHEVLTWLIRLGPFM